jgi:1-deoxy-D-xylulose-5-phosphate reductoisomerase
MKKKIVILGSTGSIGKTLIDILKKDKKNFDILLLTANKNIKELFKQAKIFNVKNIIITDREKFLISKKLFENKNIKVFNNFESINSIFKNQKIDYVMNSLVGIIGLKPTLNIIKFTKKIAIANKESIICGWPLIKAELNTNKTEFIPVDSEHFSIWSLMQNLKSNDVEKIYITASGGPFNNLPLNKFKKIIPKTALKHPSWKMGNKISIDSATMINKVFEVIEAKKIFNIEYNKIEILVHPKSYVHAIVKFKNGLTKILIHETDMTIPIFNSIYENFQKTIPSKKINLNILNDLSFNAINEKKFPAVKILKKLPNTDSLFETVLVSANDHLVNMFLKKNIRFIDISIILLKLIKLKEFTRYRSIKPKKISDILKLHDYVSLKIKALSV